VKLSSKEREVHLDSISSLDIEKYYKGVKEFGGVVANDEFKNPNKNKVYIINLENSDESGSHWVLFSNGFYCDPYGAVPTQQVAKWTTKYNTEDYQGYASEACGWFCMYIVDNILAGRLPAAGLRTDAVRYNEQILKQYFF
jgi:hypothetical protein